MPAAWLRVGLVTYRLFGFFVKVKLNVLVSYCKPPQGVGAENTFFPSAKPGTVTINCHDKAMSILTAKLTQLSCCYLGISSEAPDNTLSNSKDSFAISALRSRLMSFTSLQCM